MTAFGGRACSEQAYENPIDNTFDRGLYSLLGRCVCERVAKDDRADDGPGPPSRSTVEVASPECFRS